MTTMTQPFDASAFNFLKIRPEETLSKMEYEEEVEKSDMENLLIINVSPLEFGHSLVVPDVFAQWTQVRFSCFHCLEAAFQSMFHIFNLFSLPHSCCISPRTYAKPST